MEVSGHVWRPLGSVLVAQGVVSAEAVEEALAEQERSGERLGEILIARGYASRISIVDALAQQAGLLLEPERGFGSGLRQQLERRHREGHACGHVDRVEGADGTAELDRSTAATDLSAVLVERAREMTTSPDSSGLGHSALPPDIAFLATVARARQHLAARRAELPERVGFHQ